MKRPTRLHLGCGNIFLPGYVNIDISNTFSRTDSPDLIGDVRHMPFLPTGAFDEVYACHILEHIRWSDVALTLAEWHRVLRPGGVLRIAVPDMDAEFERYMVARVPDWESLPNLGGVFAHRKPATRSHQMAGIFVGGHDGAVGTIHRVPWNFEFLEEVLSAVGFRGVHRYSAHIADWSRYWPQSLNVLATADVRPADVYEIWEVEGIHDALPLRVRLLQSAVRLENSLIFLRAGIQEECISLPYYAHAVIETLDGKMSIAQICKHFENDGSIEVTPELLLSLVAKRVAVLLPPDGTSHGAHYVLSPALLAELGGKAVWPEGGEYADPRELLLAEDTVVVWEQRCEGQMPMTEGCTLSRGASVIQLSSDESTLLRSALIALDSDEERPRWIAEPDPMRVEAVRALARKLETAGVLENASDTKDAQARRYRK